MSSYRLLQLLCATLLLLVASHLVSYTQCGLQAGTRASLASTERVSKENILNSIGYFSDYRRIGSRFTGYSGSSAAARFIIESFNSYGLEVEVQRFNVTVPIDEGTELKISGGRTLKAYPLVPNSIQTSPTPSGGFTGSLVYVGGGTLEDFDGKDIDGAIVLMEFDSGGNWLNAAKLGAKAVILIEPDYTTRHEALSKLLDVPILFPRVYVSAADGAYLREVASSSKNEVTIVSRSFYRTVEAENVIGIARGTSLPNDVIIVSAYYDSWSIIPSISYGADEAFSVSTLLELARYFGSHPPKRTVWLVALAGHWQGILGAREFVEKYCFSSEVLSGEVRVWAQLGLWLSTSGDGVELLHIGHYYLTGLTSSLLVNRYNWITSRIMNNYKWDMADELMNTTGRDVGELVHDEIRVDNSGYGWWGTQTEPYMLDTEPLMVAGGAGFTLATSNAYRPYWGTPIDDFDFIRKDGIEYQAFIARFITEALANEDGWGNRYDEVTPNRMSIRWGWGVGYVTLQGTVKVFNVTTGWYSPLPNALVRLYLGMTNAPGTPGFRGRRYLFGDQMLYSDSNGSFVVHGLAPTTVIPGAAEQAQGWGAWSIEAYVLDEMTGEINMAPDLGIYGFKTVPPVATPLAHPSYASIVLMDCVSLTVFDILDPRTFSTPVIPDYRVLDANPGNMRGMGMQLNVYDFLTKGEPLIYGGYYNGREPVAIVFSPKGMICSVAVRYGPLFTGRPGLILVNSSANMPEGVGFRLGKSAVLKNTILVIAEDMFHLAEGRYNTLSSRNSRSLTGEEKLNQAGEHLDNARNYFASGIYSKGYLEAYQAWAWAYQSYNSDVMPLIDDSANSSLVFFCLIIPAGVLFERLVFHGRGWRRLILMIMVTLAQLLAFSFVHPSLSVMMNSGLALVGIVALLLLALATGVLGDEINKTLKRVALEKMGLHSAEIATWSRLGMSFSTALENMRRRRMRTILTFVTVLTITIALTSLTSVSNVTAIRYTETAVNASYDGLLVKDAGGIPPRGPLSHSSYEQLRALIGEEYEVFPRAWLYPRTTFPEGTFATVSGPRGSYRILTALGISSNESDYLAGKLLVRGRNFIEGDYLSCIITEEMSEAVGLDVGGKATVFGLNLTVVGIVKSNELAVSARSVDLDGLIMTPVSPLSKNVINLIPVEASLGGLPIPATWTETLVLPYELTMDLGGCLGSISIRPHGQVTMTQLAGLSRKIALSTDHGLFLGFGGKVWQVGRVSSYLMLGWGVIPVVLAIGALNIMVTLVSNVKERTKDIFIYSSVGLSPMSISAMFLVEAITYSFIGTVVGYFLGYILNGIFVSLGELPGYLFNYGSSFIMFSLAAIMISCLASSVYPATLTARMATPSLERKFKIRTSPKGNDWEVDLPSRVPQTEARGILQFLMEYFEGAGSVSRYFRVDEVQGISFADPTNMNLRLKASLYPYETGTAQEVTIFASGDRDLRFYVHLRMLHGSRSVWLSRNRDFLESLRMQLLMWRSLPPEVQKEYVKRAQ